LTAFIKTITNSLRVFGPEPTEKWASAACAAALLWGSDYWAYGTVGLEVIFTKGFSNSLGSTSDVYRGVTKRIDNAQASTSTIGLYVVKGIYEAVANTTAVGKNLTHYYDNAVANTTAVGKDLWHYYDNSQEVTNTVSTINFQYRTFSNTVTVDSTLGAYRKRDNYDVIYGGVSNVVNYPRPTSFTTGSAASTSWTTGATTSTTWS